MQKLSQSQIVYAEAYLQWLTFPGKQIIMTKFLCFHAFFNKFHDSAWILFRGRTYLLYFVRIHFRGKHQNPQKLICAKIKVKFVFLDSNTKLLMTWLTLWYLKHWLKTSKLHQRASFNTFRYFLSLLFKITTVNTPFWKVFRSSELSLTIESTEWSGKSLFTSSNTPFPNCINLYMTSFAWIHSFIF